MHQPQTRRPFITVVLFLGLLGILSIWNLLIPDREFSENENVYLQMFPAFSVERLLQGKFTAEFDTYTTDQFVFRDQWIAVKTLAERALFKPASNGVYFAKDDYLIEMFSTIDPEQYQKNLSYLADFEDAIQQRHGIGVQTMLAPTASYILSDKLPEHTPEVDQHALLAQAGTQIDNLLDISPTLHAHRTEEIFYRTDHHWTSLGAFYAYQHWRTAIQKSVPAPDDFTQTTLSSQFYGTTHSKVNLVTIPPDTITAFLPVQPVSYQVRYNHAAESADSIYAMSFLNQKDKYSTFLNANQSIVEIKTEQKNGQRLLLIKDSYANSFVQMALPDYEEITVLDMRYYRESLDALIQEFAPTDILILYSIKGFANDNNLYYLTK